MPLSLQRRICEVARSALYVLSVLMFASANVSCVLIVRLCSLCVVFAISYSLSTKRLVVAVVCSFCLTELAGGNVRSPRIVSLIAVMRLLLLCVCCCLLNDLPSRVRCAHFARVVRAVQRKRWQSLLRHLPRAIIFVKHA